MQSVIGNVCGCDESVCVRDISKAKIAFIKGNGSQGPNRSVQRQPWGYSVYSSLVIPFSSLVFVLLIRAPSYGKYVALGWKDAA